MKNKNAVFTTMGANNHSEHDRPEHDFYATDPLALRLFLLKFHAEGGRLTSKVWECCCGLGHLSDELVKFDYFPYSTDIVDRAYEYQNKTLDFFQYHKEVDMDILTNPPYNKAQKFIEHAMELLKNGRKLILFLKVSFLESQRRYEMFQKYPPKYVYIHSDRMKCGINGDFDDKSSAIAYAWYVWEKGFDGEPIIRWIKK